MEVEPTKLSSPRIFLVRMLVFLVLCVLVAVVLYQQIIVAFFANPGLNALIGLVLLVGIILTFRQVIRLYRRWPGSIISASPIPALRSTGVPPCWRRWPRSSAASVAGG